MGVDPWVLIWVSPVNAPAFPLPDWMVAALMMLLVLGSFPVLFLSWRYEFILTLPEQCKRFT